MKLSKAQKTVIKNNIDSAIRRKTEAREAIRDAEAFLAMYTPILEERDQTDEEANLANTYINELPKKR